MDLLSAIEAERLAIADRLASLDEEQLQTTSCCSDWTVLEVAAHLTQGWNYSLAHGMWQMFKARGDLGTVSNHCLAPLAAAGRDAIVNDLRENARDGFKPPGLGFEAPLNDLVMHGRDMFVPVGVEYSPEPAVVENSLNLAVAGGMVKMVNSAKKLEGLTFVAEDLDWSWGSGPEIRGSAHPLAHAMWGRHVSIGELTGPGVSELRQRLS